MSSPGVPLGPADVPKVRNPLTGQWIKVGGATYQRVMQNAKLAAQIRSEHPTLRPAFRRRLPIDQPLVAGAGQLSGDALHLDARSGAGWKEEAPYGKPARRRVRDACGDGCFLRPDHLAFPICNKCDGGKCDCRPNCRGLHAAVSRAHEWKYMTVARAAQEIAKDKGCWWAKRWEKEGKGIWQR